MSAPNRTRKKRDDDDDEEAGAWWCCCECKGVWISLIIIAYVLTTLLVIITNVEASVPLPEAPPEFRYAFTTRGLFTGALGGFDGANARCETEAETSVFPYIRNSTRIWKAILSTGVPGGKKREDTDPAIYAEGRFEAFDPGFILLPNNVTVAAYSDFWIYGFAPTTPPHLSPMNLDANGTLLVGEDLVWSGEADVTSGDHCNLWSSMSFGGEGAYGNMSLVDDGWFHPPLNSSLIPCNSTLRLMCMQDVLRP